MSNLNHDASKSDVWSQRPFLVLALIVTILLPALAAAGGFGSAAMTRDHGSTVHRAKHAQISTAWRDGSLHVAVPGVVRRSNIVLGRPNTDPTQSMPLGNGRLGAAVWSADGLTAQLNRAGTFPERRSPGQVVVPGLRKLVTAKDYKGWVDLYDGMLRESGNGMTATVYVRADKSEFVIDVTGADPNKGQIVRVRLWKPDRPLAKAWGKIAILSQVWKDDKQPGASNKTFGTLAALAVAGRQVHAMVVNRRVIQTAFKPNADGSYRIVVAVPQWAGGNAMAMAKKVLARDAQAPSSQLREKHLAWWHSFWHRVGLMKLTSTDGVAQYMENLRTIYLYLAASESRSTYPGSNGGVANLFAYNRDTRRWDPAAFWHLNLRMLVAANLGAGAFNLNAPYFRLYRDNLAHLKAWTKEKMDGRPGICIPETMRFNGKGIEYEISSGEPMVLLDCDASSPPDYNARTLSTGAEVSLWIWRQYLYTQDRHFLAHNYPIMSNAARFLLAYSKVGPNGYLHTDPSNAHETQWDVKDPATDIAAMKSLFPVVIKAATLLRRDPELAQRLKKAIPHLLPFPLTDSATHTKLLPTSADALENAVIAPSYDPAAKRRNTENIGLEPVWPYEVIGAQGPELSLARRTFKARVTRDEPQWSFDAVDAARLGLPKAVRRNLSSITEKYQTFPSGLASLFGSKQSPYIEQSANVALALQEALVQEDRGVLEIARAWPRDWDGVGTVSIRGDSKVSVQMSGGEPVVIGIQAGSNTAQQIRNPWPGQKIQVVETAGHRRATPDLDIDHVRDVRSVQPGHRIPMTVELGRKGLRRKMEVNSTSANVFTISLHQGKSYTIERVDNPVSVLPFAAVTGKAATSYKTLGPVAIGLAPPDDNLLSN